MVFLICVTSQALSPPLYLDRMGFMASAAFFMAVRRVNAGSRLVTGLAGGQFIRVGLMAPFAI